ncbi:MAG: NAD-dependent epimerase/dehydratase family protein, partial [Pseudanabaena sp.]
MTNQTIHVTGGAGYIGSHAVKVLQQDGYQVLILDNLVYGHQDIAETLGAELIVGDTNDRPLLDQLFRDRQISAVMHFAA